MSVNQRKAGALLTYGYILANAIVILLYQPIMMRCLGQAEYGLYSLMASISGYLSVLDLGLGNAVVVFTAKYRALGDIEGEKRLHGMLARIFAVIGAVVILLGAVFSANLGFFFSSSLSADEIEKGRILMLILSANMGITLMFAIYSNIIAAYEEFIFSKVLSIIKTLMGPAIMIPLLLLGGKSIVLVTVLSAVNVVCLFANRAFCRKKLEIRIKYMGLERQRLYELIIFSVFIFIAELVDKINWYVDQFIIGAMIGTEEVAVYAYAINFNQMLLLLSATIGGIMQPKITAMVARNCSKKELTAELVKFSRLQLYPILLLFAGFVILGRDFCIMHGGDGYETSYYIFIILALGEMVSLTQSVALAVIKAQNKLKFWSLLTLATAIVNIIITVPLTKYFGSVGSAAGTAVTFAFANGFMMNIYYNKHADLQMSAYWKNFGRMLIGLAPSAIITALIKWGLHLAPMAEFLICGVILVILYAVFATVFVMNSYEKGIISDAMNKILKRTA